MKLRTLPSKNLRGKRVIVRVDWNVPLTGGLLPEESLKVERSLTTLRALSKKGAKLIVLTLLGRPKGREKTFSTEKLAVLLARHYGLHLFWHSGSVSNAK